jgi:riboflavin synthase
MKRKAKMTPEEEARSEEVRRIAVARVERAGGRVPETEAESEALVRRVEARLARGYPDTGPRRASS